MDIKKIYTKAVLITISNEIGGKEMNYAGLTVMFERFLA